MYVDFTWLGQHWELADLEGSNFDFIVSNDGQ